MKMEKLKKIRSVAVFCSSLPSDNQGIHIITFCFKQINKEANDEKGKERGAGKGFRGKIIIYIDRIIDCDCDHRDSRGDAAAGTGKGSEQGSCSAVCKSVEPAWQERRLL